MELLLLLLPLIIMEATAEIGQRQMASGLGLLDSVAPFRLMLVVFLSLLFWGWVWGPVGMLLSVPLTIILKIVLENSEDFRWLAVMLGTGKPRSADHIA